MGAILFITGIVLTIIFVLKKAKDDVSIDVKIDKAMVNFAEAYKKVNGDFSKEGLPDFIKIQNKTIENDD